MQNLKFNQPDRDLLWANFNAAEAEPHIQELPNKSSQSGLVSGMDNQSKSMQPIYDTEQSFREKYNGWAQSSNSSSKRSYNQIG